MKLLSSLAGGFAGACAVTLLNEVVKKFDKGAPRIDLLGEEVVANSHEAMNLEVPTGNKLYAEALGTDLIANTVYFSIASFNDKHTEIQGGVQGVLAGLSAVYAPGMMHLFNAEQTSGTDKKKALTMAYYFVGGLVAGKVMELVDDKINKDKNSF
jgi:hypothetical protein